MDLEEYSWNRHERQLKREGKLKIPSRYKIRIKDNLELRIELEGILDSLPHKVLCLWAVENAKDFLPLFDEHLKGDQRISNAEAVLALRIQEKASAHELRSVGFIANQLCKESNSEIGRTSARVFVHSIATGHMRAHAIISSDYALQVINLLHPGSAQCVLNERRKQIILAKKFHEKSLYILELNEFY